MKNNVICLFVDSVSYSSISTHRAKVSPTPFVDSLKKESITATNLYSHGPYTDAAIRSLFTGRNCLDDFGYYFRLNTSPINDFKLFHDAGYETYGFYYPFIMHGHNIKKYIDHTIYTSGFIFGSEWGGMFKYYSEKLAKNSLNSIDFLLLKERFNLFFEVFEDYLSDIISKEECTILYKKCLQGYNKELALSLLMEEKKKFSENYKDYILNFLDAGEKHILWKIDTTNIFSEIDGQFLHKVFNDHKGFFKRINWYNFYANCLYSFPSVKRTTTALRKYFLKKDKTDFSMFENYKTCICQFLSMYKRWDKPNWQVANSTHTILSAGIELLRKRKHGDKPFYMNLMTEDAHSFISMFAYDSQNRGEVDDEIRVLEEYVDKLGTNFKGSLLYLLSLRYIDYEIEKFCKELKALGLWNNTTLMIISDHGSSFTFYPLHKSRVNCFDDECYHIPICIRHPNFKGIEIKGYNNSKDIYPTVCDLIGIPQSPFFKGHSMIDLTREEIPYVMTEYMGPGCPDIYSRPIWLSIRDKKYIVAYKVGIYEEFEDGKIAECYDLETDPDGYFNISTNIDRIKIDYLLIHLRDRFEEIKRDSNLFLDEIKDV